MKSKTKTQTTTSTTAPPDYIVGQNRFATDEARRLYDAGLPEFYPNQTYANLAPETLQAMGMTANRAMQGNAGVKAAQGYVTDAASGAFLNSNPYLGGAMDIANRGTISNYQKAIFPTINSRASRSGRYGSGLVADAQTQAREALAQSLSDSNTMMAYNNYNDERNRQQGAALMAPELAAQDYVDIDALSRVGAKNEEQAQKGIAEDMARYDYGANAESTALDQFLQRLGLTTSNAGTVNTTQQEVPKSNAFGQILGLASAGLGYAMGGPAGGAIGSNVGNSLFGGSVPGTSSSGWYSSPMSDSLARAYGINWS